MDGETGVAVTRETIISLSGALLHGGRAVLGNATLPTTNQGTIASDAGAEISVLGNPLTNSGTLRGDGAGSKVTVHSTSFNNAGTIQQVNGGQVLINP
jgi:hypothetical protein